jgi:hypothetical protein
MSPETVRTVTSSTTTSAGVDLQQRMASTKGPNIMTRRLILSTVAVVAISIAFGSRSASAHCDTMNGPVVTAARLALEKGDVTPVLKWVKPEAEAEIRAAFAQTLTVRKAGPQARDLADRFFFETLVRIHRSGEGAPYTGLKPANTPVDPAVQAADHALENGASADAVVKLVSAHIADGVRDRWQRVEDAKKHANESVEAGRKYVEAYVDYVHYVENVHLAASAAHSGHAGEGTQTALHVHR